MNELDLFAGDDGGLRELALFAGAGGGILGGILNGWKTVCAVERDVYAAAILAQRQNDGILDPFPIWSEIRTFDGRPWKGIIDIVSGGFPCQDISVAGKKEGITGKRSGLWSQMARVIGEVEPKYVWIENSPNLKNKGLEVILEDLRKMGYDVRWGVVSAENAGAPHKRERLWILANTNSSRRLREGSTQSEEWNSDFKSIGSGSNVSNSNGSRCEEQWLFQPDEPEYQTIECGSWWETEPGICRVVDGMAHRVDRLKAIGNGQVPAVVRLAWEILNK